jgi:hypothetical protein
MTRVSKRATLPNVQPMRVPALLPGQFTASPIGAEIEALNERTRIALFMDIKRHFCLIFYPVLTMAALLCRLKPTRSLPIARKVCTRTRPSGLVFYGPNLAARVNQPSIRARDAAHDVVFDRRRSSDRRGWASQSVSRSRATINHPENARTGTVAIRPPRRSRPKCLRAVTAGCTVVVCLDPTAVLMDQSPGPSAPAATAES